MKRDLVPIRDACGELECLTELPQAILVLTYDELLARQNTSQLYARLAQLILDRNLQATLDGWRGHVLFSRDGKKLWLY